jgi:hypothetical protein
MIVQNDPVVEARLDLDRIIKGAPIDPGFDLLFADPEFLYLTGDRHRKSVYESNVLRNLEVCDFTPAVVADVLFGHGFSRFQAYPGQQSFAESRVRKPHNVHIRDFGMAVQKLFDFSRIDVFAAAYDHFL